jgi:hypothetical protein
MKMKPVTIIAMLAELIEYHMEKCEAGNLDGAELPHVVSHMQGHSANITTVRNVSMDTMLLTLDDGSEFQIRVTPLT